ncbi:FprA family A-type flavoprotein [Candidatus Zixiibacteriota bacterium]
MNPRKLRENIWAVGTIDWDRRLFDDLVPLPEGTSYNAFLLKGSEKTALIDGVDPAVEQVLLDNLRSLGVEKLDYIVSNHAEQDHSGAIPAVLKAYPEAMVVTNPRCASMLTDHLHIAHDRFIHKDDEETLSLGNWTLQFFLAPFVHWPETQFTWLQEEKILFSGDFLGSHQATSDLFMRDQAGSWIGAKRYYAEIMMPYRKKFPKYLDRIDTLAPEIIAPTHGPIHDQPAFILDAYRDWSSDTVKNDVVVAYVSMHDTTAKMAHYLLNGLIDRGMNVKVHNLTGVDVGELAIDLVDAATIIWGSPIVGVGPHPNVAYAAFLANVLKPKAKFMAIIGSYGWGGKMVDQLLSMQTNIKAEVLEPVMVKGFPREEDFAALDSLADGIAGKHRSEGLL